ncbi:MAG: aromatic amino acid transport family protein [Candidatus Paceibacterota bacterium]|jgi:tyrosine-specific transport protein
MLKNLRVSLKAISVIVGTIIGVGIFGLPQAVARIGFFPGIVMLALLSLATLYLHYLYGEIVLRTKSKKRLVGYAEKYLGSRGKTIAAASALFGLVGSQLAYLIVGGDFLKIISRNILGSNPLFYIAIFLIVGSLVVLKGTSAIASVDFLMSVFLITVIVVIFCIAFPQIDTDHFSGINMKNTFPAYGVMLFSLSGAIAIPETIEYLRKKKNKNYKTVITVGTILPHLLYVLFIVATVGLVGRTIGESAIADLETYLGSNIVIIGALFGIIAIFTSFIVTGATLMKILWYDYKIPKLLSWLIISILPLVLFIGGIQSFILIIGVVGAVMGGIDGILVILIFQKLKKSSNSKPVIVSEFSQLLKWLLLTIFIVGILYEIYYFASTR